MPDLVQPLDPSQAPAPEATPQEVQPAQGETPPAQSLPKDLLKIPAMQALVAGSPAAVSISLKTFGKKGESKILVQHKDLLQQAGFNFYRSIHGDTGVIFNQLHIHPEDLMAADKAGKLAQIAPPWDVVDHAISKSGHNNPVLTRTGVPTGLAMPTPKAAPQLSATLPPGTSPTPPAQMGRPQPAGAQRALAMARTRALQPGAPTSGPEPGAGRLLNQILKPVV